MASLKYLGLAALAGAGVLLSAAGTDVPWAQRGNVVVPVVTALGSDDYSITACMYVGATPQVYRVVEKICKSGASECTAFVAVPDGIAEIVIGGYDLSDPPREATGPVCERPTFRPTGVFHAPS